MRRSLVHSLQTKSSILVTRPARSAYQDFLAPWKDADPDIPILKQANSEYAELH
jgi:hypothetical protein